MTDETRDPAEHAKGGLEPAPVTPTEEKSEPEAGTGGADKRSGESLAEGDRDPAETGERPGAAGGNQTA